MILFPLSNIPPTIRSYNELITAIIALEAESYPSGEAASAKMIEFRATKVPQHFIVAYDEEKNKVLGFANSTRSYASTLTHEAMSNDEANGATLMIHSVVVAQYARRKGHGSTILAALVDSAQNCPTLTRIVLVCKPDLVPFYHAGGFSFVQDSPLSHGKESWFEFARSLSSIPSCVVDAFVVPGRNRFSGNPAAVLVLPTSSTHSSPSPPSPNNNKRLHLITPTTTTTTTNTFSDTWKADVASEFNLSETAFVEMMDPAPRLGATVGDALSRLVWCVKAGTKTLMFSDVLRVLDSSFHFNTNIYLSVGEVISNPGQNVGSFKVLAFAELAHLKDRKSTALLWGEHFRDVMKEPHGTSHPNIRAYLQGGFVSFSDGSNFNVHQPPITVAKNAFGMQWLIRANFIPRALHCAPGNNFTSLVKLVGGDDSRCPPHHSCLMFDHILDGAPLPDSKSWDYVAELDGSTLALAVRNRRYVPANIVHTSVTSYLSKHGIDHNAVIKIGEHTMKNASVLHFARCMSLDVCSTRYLLELAQSSKLMVSTFDRFVQCVSVDLQVDYMYECEDTIPSLDIVQASLRWFTPTIEVELCGHATLAACHALMFDGLVGGGNNNWHDFMWECPMVSFHTKSGVLNAIRRPGRAVELQFPKIETVPVTMSSSSLLADSLGIKPDDIVDVRAAGKDLLVRVRDAIVFDGIKPHFDKIAQAHSGRSICVTSPGDGRESCTFLSRFFAPNAGINEDPVTGSSHCYLCPYWGGGGGGVGGVGVGYQASKRGGVVKCHVVNDKVVLQGISKSVWKGHMNLL